ncbi:hypothetical protein [Pedobacter punctiformis]|uniref:DUF3299 domain-containing protein n=1 Tax=Pedobacter punctiformis TaxID=3004097 RepID=A0ABT4L811_9SPHI|nr:hypothetical protein [Pedobacter sp. HCMS5-2]MCZ4243971.1 hypothetical protein [Pedobacter sp. HCMS5-2]
MKNLTSLLLLFVSLNAFPQQKKHHAADQIKSLNWDVIGTVKFELTDKNELLPIYGETIKRFNNSEFDLKGYLIPVKNTAKHAKFLLATLPINQCYFCGQNGIPIMIMVEMNQPIEFTDKPIRVKGTLKLANTNATYAPPVSITKATLII